MILLIKNALWLYSELCFLCRREAHFQKIHEKMLPGSEKWSQNHVRYIKIPATWGRIHEDGVKIMLDISIKSPKEATVAIIHTDARFFEVQLGRHGGDKRGKERATER